MKRFVVALCAGLLPIAAAGCATNGYGYGYGYGEPLAYNGYYDDFYGPVYDGYWGDDGFFYYRGGVGERRFRRGDAAHFRRDGGGAGFHNFGGNFARGRGMRTPHFGAGRGGGGGPRGGHR